MEVTSRRVGSALVLSLEGQLTAAVDTWVLHESARQLAEPGLSDVVVDLERLTLLDCSGIGELLTLHERALSFGGTTKLVNVDEHHGQLLEALGLREILPVHGSVAEALRCRPGSAPSQPTSAKPNPTRKLCPCVVGALLALLLMSASALADNVYLKNGRVILNVETKIEGDRITVTRDGMELTLPLDLVDHIEKVEARPVARPVSDPRTSTASGAAESGPVSTPPPPGISPQNVGDRSGAPEPVEAVVAEPERTPAFGKITTGEGGRVRFNNGLDVINFDLPPGIWVFYGEADGDEPEGDAWDLLDPSELMKGREGMAAYTLIIWPYVFDQSSGGGQNRQASWWIDMARAELNLLPTQNRRSAREIKHRVGGQLYSTLHYWHDWRNLEFREDGLFLLYFPDDYRKRNRFYVFLWALTYTREFRGIDIDMASFDTVVESFAVEPLRPGGD